MTKTNSGAALADFKEDFVLLLEAGFVAINQMDEDGATKLFNAAALLNPESTAPQIGMAAIALYKLDTKRSGAILEEILKKEPDNARASAMLGISYLLGSDKIEEGEKLLKDAIEKSDDPAVEKLGKLWIEVLEKGARKAPASLKPQN